MATGVPSTRKILLRMGLTVLLVAGLVVCWNLCSQRTFLIVFVVSVSVYIGLQLWEATRSKGNRPKWGRQEPMEGE